MNWKYHSVYKWWEGSKGTGLFAVKKMSGNKGWVVMRVPWPCQPQVITVCASKKAGMEKAESLA